MPGILLLKASQAITITGKADRRLIRRPLANSFLSGVIYDPVGPNSNTFMHWLIQDSGLSQIYSGAPPGAVGWNTPFAPMLPEKRPIPGPHRGSGGVTI